MIRFVLFIGAVAFVAWGAVWFADNPGRVTVDWAGWHVDAGAGVALAAVGGVAVFAALAYRLFLLIVHAPKQVKGALKERRLRKGYRALTQGMVAVAAGDGAESAKQVKRADVLLDDPPLTLLLKAQSAQLNGDETAAEQFFTTMLEKEETEFLGLRGLLGQAMKRGDRKTALEIARRARELKPKSEWLADVLFELESALGNWEQAQLSLKLATSAKSLSPDAARRRNAVVAYGRSLEAENRNDFSGRIKWAEKSFSHDAAFTPAAIRLAKLYLGAGRKRKAASLIERVWGRQPHPELLPPYFECRDAFDPMKKLKAAEKLAATNPKNVESVIAVACAALEAKLWGQARAYLDEAIKAGAGSRRVFTMRAKLEEQVNANHEEAAHWLSLAASAPQDAAWTCTHCGSLNGSWVPYCPSCGGLDTIDWRTPDARLAISPPVDALHGTAAAPGAETPAHGDGAPKQLPVHATTALH